MNKFLNESKNKFSIDYTLLLILGLHVLISLVAIYMASPLLDAHLGNVVSKQVMWFGIGAVFVLVLIKMGTDRLFTMIDVLYWFLIIALLGLVVFRFLYEKAGIRIPFAFNVNGSFAWYQIPGIGSFQPSEFMKIILVIKAANIVDQHNIEKTKLDFSSDLQLAVKFVKLVAVPLLLILLQPDTGIPIIIIFSLAILFFVSGVKRQWFIIIFGIAAFALFGVVWLYFNAPNVLSAITGGGYRLNRFRGWLEFESASSSDGFQVFRSILSYGTAGMSGHRPLPSLVLWYPEAQTDFIFSVIAQNFGFLGGLFTIITVFALDIKLILTALKSDLSRERYMLIGVVGMLMFQQFQNIGMVTALLPITGVTLPFISYGGSSTISYLIPIAVAFTTYSDTQRIKPKR